MTLGIIGADGSVSRNPLAPNAPTFPEMYEKVNGKKLEGSVDFKVLLQHIY